MEPNVALRLMEEWQGALRCVTVETSPPNLQQQFFKAPRSPALPDDEETSPWSTAKLEYSHFDTWLTSAEEQATLRAILDVLCAHRAVIPDKLPTGLTPKRPHDHRILLVPGKLPTKSAVYRMTAEQFQFHKQEIAKLSANGWIGPTYSPIWAPTIMVDKRSDATGEHKMRMVVNNQELTCLTIAPDFPLLPIQTILEMLGGAQYFSTLDLDAEGIKPATDKIQAIKAWPEVMENEMQIRQFLGTVNYCRMFMGPDFAKVVRQLVDLTRKGAPFQWTDTHTQAVRQLKERLIDYTTLQIPDTTKPFELYTDASGEPYHTASSKPGEVVRLEFQHRRHTFRYVLSYLRVCVNGLWLICAPQFPEFLTHVLYTHHDHVTAGHRGQKKTYTALSKHYYWPGMRTYTNAYVESCAQCRASKSLNQTPAGLLQQLLIPSRRWSHVSLDFVTSLPLTTAGHDAMLVAVDSLSKRAHFIPAKKSHLAVDIVELLADRLTRNHSFPDILVSDRDPRFRTEVWSQLCSRFNITRAMSSSYHPQTDGQTERVNRTLEQMLRTYVQADEREWEGLLPALELVYNTTSHSSTELSAFEIMIGENPLIAADLDIVAAWAPTLTPPMTKLFRKLCDRAQSHILKAKWRQKYYADAYRRAVEDKVGDQVWLSSKHLPARPSLAQQ
ncbi:hypothetical protein EBH_0069500 [Eimeria brunetti]|uniref:Integrase catalytic domain-containing protein n=1 Tax=Eimeria brunetti TaxID=51314 RepID=U6L9T0_9EIME|nr:hypothetical protein EBH_0069500 [Eimeria brunetti]